MAAEDDTTRPKRRWLPRLLLVVTATAAALGVAEWAFRLMQPRQYEPPMFQTLEGASIAPAERIAAVLAVSRRLGTGEPATGLTAGLHMKGWYDRPKWDYFDENGCVDYRLNALGFRDTEFEIAKSPGEYRVLCVGDSFTFGLGVPLEATWVQVVERELDKRLDRPVQVMNAGFAYGHHPGMYSAWVALDGIRFKPDLIVVALCLNDVGRIPLTWAAKSDHSLSEYSRLYKFLHDGYLQRQGPPSDLEYAERIDAAPKRWNEATYALTELHTFLQKRGFPMLVVIQPMLSCLKEGQHNPFLGVHQRLRALLDEKGVPHIDLLEEFVGRDERPLWVHPRDQHPNDIGHEIIGKALVDHLLPR